MFLWPVTIKEAIRVQETLAGQVRIEPFKGTVKRIAGVDAAFIGAKTIGAVIVFDYKSMEIIDSAFSVTETPFPYVPGYLSFREGPAIVAAFRKLKLWPDVIIFDGQGIAHPRRMGIASHLGVFLRTPSIGCAKSRLVGEYKEPGGERGSYSYLYYEGEIVGAVLRTRAAVKPVFVSPGHMVSLDDAIKTVLSCSKYRLPEPIRMVDRWCKWIKRECAHEPEAMACQV